MTMIIEEAVQTLKRIIQVADSHDTGVKEIDGIDEEAINMGIEALTAINYLIEQINPAIAKYHNGSRKEIWSYDEILALIKEGSRL